MGRFGQLAKIRHHAVEALQKDLQEANAAVQAKTEALEALKNELAEQAKPQSGTVSEYASHQANLHIFRRQIGDLEKLIYQLHQRAFQVRFHLKKALIEYEKMNHLDKEERAQTALLIKKLETGRLEEAALNGHHIQNGGSR